MRVPYNVKFSPINFSFDTNFTVKLKENILFHLSEKATPELVSIITKEIDEKCEAHNTEHYTVYCYNCNKHLCSKCIEERLHDEHKKETLKKDLNIQQITESLEKAKNHIDKDLFDIKQRFMKNLMHKISDIEFAYGKCRNYNSATLMFVKSLIECYSNSQPNYFVKENLLKHTNFNFSCFQMDETEKETTIELDDVIEFYNQFVILAKPANDMGESKEEEKQEIRSRLSTCSSMNLKGMKIVRMLYLLIDKRRFGQSFCKISPSK